MKKIGVVILLAVFVFSLASVDAKMVNCKQDRTCFIELAENCERGQFTEKSEFWFLGLIIKSESVMKIRGDDSGSCALYVKNKKMGVTLDREFFEELGGEEIDSKEFLRAERQINGMAKRQVQGKDMICKFNDAEGLVNYLDAEILIGDELPDCIGGLTNGLGNFEFIGPV